jgi:titin
MHEVYSLDVPGAPRDAQVDSVSDDSVRLSWHAPEDDGGSYITNYVIEKLDTDTGKWIRAGTSRSPHYTVENLIPKKQYQFRIIAENIFGPGAPSEPTKTVQTLDSDANLKRRTGKDDEASRRKNKDLPKLDNYDRCCK